MLSSVSSHHHGFKIPTSVNRGNISLILWHKHGGQVSRKHQKVWLMASFMDRRVS